MHYLPLFCLVLLLTAFCIVPASAAEYAIGDKITLSGINPNSEYTYLYMQGVNVPLQEIPLLDGGYLTTSSHGIDVDEVSNRWSVSFYLANRFDAGTYTIYASPAPLSYINGHTVKKDDNQILHTYQVTLSGAYFSPVPSPSAAVPVNPTLQKTPEAVKTFAAVTSVPVKTDPPKSNPAVWIMFAAVCAAAVLYRK